MLTSMFGDALSYAKDKAMISGTGVGQPEGVLNADAGIEITKEAGQVADTIVPENIVKMRARGWGRMTDLMWIVNPDTLPQLYLMTKDVGTGGSIVWMPGNSMAGVPHDTLMGIPIVMSDHAETIGDAGDIILVNWKQYLWGRAASGITSDTSIHLKFDFDQSAFRILEYVDGAAWWSAALTPENSAATRSPIVTLAARA